MASSSEGFRKALESRIDSSLRQHEARIVTRAALEPDGQTLIGEYNLRHSEGLGTPIGQVLSPADTVKARIFLELMGGQGLSNADSLPSDKGSYRGYPIGLSSIAIGRMLGNNEFPRNQSLVVKVPKSTVGWPTYDYERDVYLCEDLSLRFKNSSGYGQQLPLEQSIDQPYFVFLCQPAIEETRSVVSAPGKSNVELSNFGAYSVGSPGKDTVSYIKESYFRSATLDSILLTQVN